MKLILFFNGWGMDDNVIKQLNCPLHYELKIVNFPYKVHINQDKYEEIIAIGWSFGCYYLTKYLIKTKLFCKEIIAINGHNSLLGNYGINPKMFDLTLKTLTPQTLLKFYKNMDIDSSFRIPQKDFLSLKMELQYFKDNYQELPFIFTKAFIGDKDKIIPAYKQEKLFIQKNIPVYKLSGGHYLWHKINNWQYFIKEYTHEF